MLRALQEACMSLSKRPSPTTSLPFLPPAHRRWVMPFSRQHTLTALSFMPLVPWALKVKFVQASGAQVHSLQRCLMQWQAGSMLSMLPSGRVSLPAPVCCSAVTAARRTPAAPPPLSALPLCARCSSDCSGGSRSSSSTRWGWATCRPPARWTSRTGQVG